MIKQLIEPLLRHDRMQKITPYLPAGSVLVDIGCGNPPTVLNLFKDKLDFCIGIDSNVENKVIGNIQLMNYFIKKNLPIESELADVVTMLAVLEHLDYPQVIAKELYRIIKPGGVLLLTVPSPINKPLLELLAKLHIVNPTMIAQHKNYFSHQNLKEIFLKAGFRFVSVSSFQFGLNTFMHATK